MKLFKKIDLGIQLVLIAAFVAWSVYRSFTYGDQGEVFIYGCFTVGTWQLLSLLLHAFLDRHYYPVIGRKNYAYLTLLTGLLAVSASLGRSLLFFYLMALCVIGPLLAVWYLFICYREIVLLEKKSLIHLK